MHGVHTFEPPVRRTVPAATSKRLTLTSAARSGADAACAHARSMAKPSTPCSPRCAIQSCLYSVIHVWLDGGAGVCVIRPSG